MAEVARNEYMQALKAYHDLKKEPDSPASDRSKEDRRRLAEFMRPSYWQSLNRSVELKSKQMQEYRNSSSGAYQYAKEIGRKYA